MAGYSPLKITGMTTGLVQEREEFLLPDDAYPKLRNAYVWRERIKRKKGCLLLGRLRRNLPVVAWFTSSASIWSFTIKTQRGFVLTANNANPGKVTTTYPHGLTTGDQVVISGVVGAVGYNNTIFTVTVVDSVNFTIGVNAAAFGAYVSGGTFISNRASSEVDSQIVPGTLIFTIGGITFTDQGNGTLTSPTPGNSGTINYVTGVVTLTHTGGVGAATTILVSYYPMLPVMGVRTRELQNSLSDQTVFFDQVYAYIFNGTTNQFQEFIPGTAWNAHNGAVSAVDFFWSTNYWVSQTTIPVIVGPTIPFFTTSNQKLFWETNNTGQFGPAADPPRITDGTTWYPFYNDVTPALTPWAQIDATDYLVNFLSMLPFRGRMVTFNTWEGTNATSAANFSNRIRWSTIGNPFIPYLPAIAGVRPASGSWRDDIRGQGGFLDIPTSEDIISVGFVRDNLVIYCERSTWQLRYTGRSIAPFQIERVNSELGGSGPFSSIQFDTSLVGIGDKGIVECDSYKSERIDIKILDFVFEIQSKNNGPFRVHGIRDFINRLAFWTVPLSSDYDARVPNENRIFPNVRLVYNYENDSWATFQDSLTAIGTFQPQSSRTWLTTGIPWEECNFSWIGTQASGQPAIVAGNQQGYVEFLDYKTVNDVSLSISDVQPNTTIPTVITSPNHNLKTGYVIGIRNIPVGINSPYSNLNGGVYGIVLGDNTNNDPTNKFRLMLFNSTDGQFSIPQVDVPNGAYIGGGQINILENFSIVSKKFNFLDEGQSIQLGYLDILMDATELSQPGAISLNVYLDYNQSDASNTIPKNEQPDSQLPDTFFNSIIPTTPSTLNTKGGTKFWQRVICPTRSNFLTLEYKFSNAQMAGGEQGKDVQIDAQVLWIRKAGRMTQI